MKTIITKDKKGLSLNGQFHSFENHPNVDEKYYGSSAYIGENYYHKGQEVKAQVFRKDLKTNKNTLISRKFKKFGKYHSPDDNTPSFEDTNGYKAFHKNGQYHRENGPAIIYHKLTNSDPNHYDLWYKDGKFIKQEPHDPKYIKDLKKE